VGYLPAEQPRVTILVSLDEPQGDMAWGGAAAAPVFSAIARQTMRYLRVPSDGSQRRLSDMPIVRLERPPVSASMFTLSAENFVENVREAMRDMMDHMTAYVRGRFLTVDAKEVRKTRRKAERSER
jgi:hypothetical protein